MRTYFIRLLIILLIAGPGLESVRAQSTDQNYPVTASAFIMAQPNQKLASYFSSSRALTVSLLLKDLTKNSIQVYLRWSLDGPGVRVASMDGYIPANLITLDRGMLRRFSGLELQSDYFRNSVIEEQGLGGSALRTNLPEGFYTFRVQVMEAGTGRQVSNIAETYFSITTPLPPVINLPFNGAVLRQAQDDGSVTLSLSKSPQIQWMPRHYKQAGNTTTYDLKVCKVADGFEPQEALDACVNPIIDDKANPGTFYPGNTGIGNSIIGAFDPSTPLGMTIGARYAVRVTVHEFDANGDEVVFANEGRSEVVWFTYGSACVSPENFTIKEIGPGRVHLSWEPQSGVDSYKILYRPAAGSGGQGHGKWNVQTVSAASGTIQGLATGKYEIAVQSACTDVMPANLQAFELMEEAEIPSLFPAITKVGGFSVDSLVAILDTARIPCASQISSYESCSADHPKINPSGTVQLTSLTPGDILTIYDIPVIVTETNGGSPFSGKGLARMASMKSTLVPVEFGNIKAWKGEEGTGGTPAARGGCVYQVDGYFRSYTLVNDNAEQPVVSENDSALAKIRYVVVSPITSSTASISWLGSQAFAKYIVRYKTSTGGELQADVRNVKIHLVGLREAMHYTFEIDAYGANGKLLDTYLGGAFTTATEGIAMPQNLHPVWKDSSGVLTWDADPQHISYKLIYRDKDGFDKTFYPTSNRAIVPGLDSMLTYPFWLIAIGKNTNGSVLESDPASGAFTARINADTTDIDHTVDLTEEVIVKGHAEWQGTVDTYGDSFDEPTIETNAAAVDIQILSPNNPMSKPLKGIESYEHFKQRVCQGDNEITASHKYKLYVIGELFKGLVKVTGDAADNIWEAITSPFEGLTDFIVSLFDKVDKNQNENPSKGLDEIIADVYYQMTIVEYLNTPDASGNYPEIEPCLPAPTWTKKVRECELDFIKKTGKKVDLPILVVNKDGNPVEVVNARQNESGDYYYKDDEKNIEYWKLQGTYLIGRVSNKHWIYWNIYSNKWCGFSPGNVILTVVETTNVCEDTSVPSLGGEIKVRVLNGQGPYRFSAGNGQSYSSEQPYFTFDNVGGGLVDLTVTDSKGCEAILADQSLQTVPPMGLDVAVKLRECNNSVMLTPVCGTAPFQYSMDGKTYQKSNEFKGIQNLIGAAGECDNGLSKSFTFYIKDARGLIGRKTVQINRNNYVSMGVRKLKNQTFPGYQDEVFVQCGSGQDYKNIRHVNMSSGVLISHTEKFCEETKGSIRLESSSADNSGAPYTYRLIRPDGEVTSVTSEFAGYKFTGLNPGHYRIEGEDGNGCAVESFHSRKSWSGYDAQEVDIADASMTVQVTPTNPSCGDGTGFVDITAKGGAFKRDFAANLASTGGYYIPYQRLFVNNVYIDNLNKNTKDLRSDSNFPPNHFRLFRPAGIYEIKVTDHLGCGITQKLTLAAPPPLTLTTQVQPATSNTSASVKLLAAGGSPPLEYVLSGPGMDEIRQPDVDFTNLIPGSYLARVVDAQNCYTNNGFIIGEPLSVTATVSNAKCEDDGSVSLVTSGGLPPFSFSIDHSPFQESPGFKNLGAGSYTVTAKDGQNAEATKIVTIAAPTEIVVVPSMFLPTMRVGATTEDKSVTADGFIHVRYDENSRKTSFKLKEGFDLRPTSSGLWQLTVSSNDPDDKKYEGIYQAYFNACNHSLFIGFYKDGQYPNCVSDNHIGLRGERFCPEGWLPEDSYSDLVKNIMIFANGYRFYGKGAAGILINSPKEYNETNNLITSDAINRYWSKESIAEVDQTDMDIEFVARRKPDVVYYADGHHSITTSNHNVANDVNRSMSEKFAPGIIGSMLAQANMAVSTIEEQFIYILSAMAADGYTVFEADKPVILKSIEEFRKKHKDILNCSGNPACVVLDTEPNDAGFKTRWENGKLAASDLLVRMASTKRPPNAKVIYNIDIVAHSMGFAYAQGMIEALKSHNNITWGSYYIIAPENGCSATYGKVDPAQWKDQIWQYGSNLGQGDPDPLWNQDGVAPQCEVGNIGFGRRAFIPATYGNGKSIPKGYLESHSISNYGWIFNVLTPDDKGYVTPK